MPIDVYLLISDDKFRNISLLLDLSFAFIALSKYWLIHVHIGEFLSLFYKEVLDCCYGPAESDQAIVARRDK